MTLGHNNFLCTYLCHKMDGTFLCAILHSASLFLEYPIKFWNTVTSRFMWNLRKHSEVCEAGICRSSGFTAPKPEFFVQIDGSRQSSFDVAIIQVELAILSEPGVFDIAPLWPWIADFFCPSSSFCLETNLETMVAQLSLSRKYRERSS